MGHLCLLQRWIWVMIKEVGLVTLVEGAFSFRDKHRADARITVTYPHAGQKEAALRVIGGDDDGLMPQVIHEGVSAHGDNASPFEDNGDGLVMANKNRLRETDAHRGEHGNHTNYCGNDHFSHR